MPRLEDYLGERKVEGRVEGLAGRVERIFGVRLNDIQSEAIRLIELTDDNIIVSAPTGSGKTLIGYAALLHAGRGFYLAPLISLMMEKFYELSRALGGMYRVMVSNRDYRIPASRFLSADFKVMSPYKFLALFNMIDPAEHGNVLVVDEIHKMSEDPLFEAAITLARRKGFRIIGLSATLADSDIALLSKWFDARVVKGHVRPVELRFESVKLRQRGYQLVPEHEYAVNGRPAISHADVFYSREEAAAKLALRIHLATGKPVIVWAPTRNRVEKIAKLIASQLAESPRYQQVARKLPASNPSERLLKYTATRGVFIHHGGLSATARDMVEKAYKTLGGIMVTAYTLSHGVNMPGTYLVFSTVFDWRGELVSPSLFHQIAGRAGRPGYDSYGVAVTLLVDDAEEAYYSNVLVKVRASEIIPKLLDSPFNAVKMLLPVVNRHGMREAERLLRESYSYLKNPDEGKVKAIMPALEQAVKYYHERVGGRRARAAMDMGLHPLEYEIVEVALSKEYREALGEIINKASAIHGVNPERVADDIARYGFLAIWLGNWEARMVADTIQTVLETGVFYAGRVFGWKSPERERASSMAKMFTYAGNPRVEPLAREVRIDVLRRMIKAAPQIVGGAQGLEEAYAATIVAVKEAFLLRKTVDPAKVRRLARLVWYAITGRDSMPAELEAEVLKEAREA